MISIVSVFNNIDTLNRCLLHSLEQQDAIHERILVDNRDGRFPSGSTALNWGASQAKGDWIIFVHQDVFLVGTDWLSRAESILNNISPNLGWAGVVGQSPSGSHGFIINRHMLLGHPFEIPQAVSTLDECVLIHRGGNKARYFDESLSGWHAYGVETCCRALSEGLTNYVIPLLINHESRSTNKTGLEEAHQYVWARYGNILGRIPTTCGWIPSASVAPLKVVERFKNSIKRRMWGIRVKARKYEPRAVVEVGEIVEEMIGNVQDVSVWHAKNMIMPLEVQGFTFAPRKMRKVTHYFLGLEAPKAEVVCIANDLIEGISADLERFTRQIDHTVTIICTNEKEMERRPLLRNYLERLSKKRVNCRFWDDVDGNELVYCLGK